MQNLVLVVQNTVDIHEIGTASGVVSFFRSLGGTVGHRRPRRHPRQPSR